MPKINVVATWACFLNALCLFTMNLCAEEIGISVPAGFQIRQFAGDDLAHNIFSMTTDARGRVVVSGPGYIRILSDTTGDGIADQATDFVNGPEDGTQGMYFVGTDLYCVAENGLVRYRDTNGDDKADGPPQKFLKLRTGGEHNAHAIRKGPDGWFYLICGNTTEIDASYATLKSSPIKEPQAGTLLRLTPDLAGGEIVADGIRNAYDFDFNADGEMFVFDSDGEQDMTLPWYVPTRLIQAIPGSSLGWVSESWKLPKHFLEMPPVTAEMGRGSPTGVLNYRHNQFPKEFRDCLFVLDWTYGKVIAVKTIQDGSVSRSVHRTFMSGIGEFGFAPTDAVVGPQGEMYVTVGGRGTRGGVYRIDYIGKRGTTQPWSSLAANASTAQQLDYVLDAAQPLSSWSRAIWKPLAKQLGEEIFLQAAVQPNRKTAQRVRAIEILVEQFQGVDRDLLKRLSTDPSEQVRARAIWAWGRQQTNLMDATIFARYLNDSHPMVQRAALVALQPFQAEELTEVVGQVVPLLQAKDRFVRQAATQIVSQFRREDFAAAAQQAVDLGWDAALGIAWAYTMRNQGYNEYALTIGKRILETDFPVELKREAVMLLQKGLGGIGHIDSIPPTFDSYNAQGNLTEAQETLGGLAETVLEVFPANDALLNHELIRLLGMMQPRHPEIVTELLSVVSESTSVLHDIHVLAALGKQTIPPTAEQSQQIAELLLNIPLKIEAQDLPQDNNWADRMGEIVTALVELDAQLPQSMVASAKFGHPGHIVFLSQLNEEQIGPALEAFGKTVLNNPEEIRWSSDLIYVLAEAGDPRIRPLLLDRVHEFALRPSILTVLSSDPQPEERALFVDGLDMAQTEVIAACVEGLSLLPASSEAKENARLLKCARRLTDSVANEETINTILAMLKRNLGVDPTATQTAAIDLPLLPGDVVKSGNQPLSQKQKLQRWQDYMTKTFSAEEVAMSQVSASDLNAILEQVKAIPVGSGNAQRGEALFAARSCAQCHGSSRALGPDLAGVTKRFSKNDLFIAIADPHRDVSPRYQATSVVTSEGKVYTGLILYEAIDGLVLRNGLNQTFRIEMDQIEERQHLKESLMPTGLLKDLSTEELADLYAYLKKLGTTQQAGGAKFPQR